MLQMSEVFQSRAALRHFQSIPSSLPLSLSTWASGLASVAAAGPAPWRKARTFKPLCSDSLGIKCCSWGSPPTTPWAAPPAERKGGEKKGEKKNAGFLSSSRAMRSSSASTPSSRRCPPAPTPAAGAPLRPTASCRASPASAWGTLSPSPWGSSSCSRPSSWCPTSAAGAPPAGAGAGAAAALPAPIPPLPPCPSQTLAAREGSRTSSSSPRKTRRRRRRKAPAAAPPLAWIRRP